METRIIKNRECELSYCHNCGENKFCAKVGLKGWSYTALICSSCLMAFVNELSNKEISLRQLENHNGKTS